MNLTDSTEIVRPTQTIANQRIKTGSNCLISYIEVWVPSVDGQHLCLSSACRVGDRRALLENKVSPIAIGEGIAGRAWKQRSSTIVQESPSELLQHYCQVSGESLVALIAIPLFAQSSICGVVVLGLGEGLGGIELWSRDDRDELAVTASYYRGLKSLEFIHQYVRFPKGGGFPGKIWKSGQPAVMHDLSSHADVVSTFAHDEAEITSVLGVPIGSSGGFAQSVLMMMSAQQSPLAGAIECCQCSTEIVRADDDSELDSSMKISVTASAGVLLTGDGEQPRRWHSDEKWQQLVCERLSNKPVPQLLHSEQITLPDGAEIALVLPVFRVQKLENIINFFF